MDLDRVVINGMAEILWGLSWADHVEEARCRSLSGVRIEKVMPPIPERVFRICEWVADQIETANNNRSIDALLHDAAWVDGLCEDPKDIWKYLTEPYAERFGNCLTYMAMKAGVSWFDDHARFNLKVPDVLLGGEHTLDLQIYAAETCKLCTR